MGAWRWGAQCTVLGVILALLALLQRVQAYDWQWRVGRATNYGAAGDPWSIHHGSCGYYYLDPTRNKGWDVAALPDAVADFTGSCGRCYEIACEPMHLTDGYGTGLDRTHVCYNAGKSVTVMITDSCPCNYPDNYYSNKRWCCNDYYHFDMSSWAFEKLADRKWGVIGVKYRAVPCDYCPQDPATHPDGVHPSPPVQDPPSGWQPSMDKRPYGKMCFKSSTETMDQGSTDSSHDHQQQQQQGQQGNGGSSWSSMFGAGSLFSGWKDISYNYGNTWTLQGPDGTNAFCGKLQGYGAVQFRGSTGSLMGKKQLYFNVQLDSSSTVPDITINIASSQKGTCRSINLRSVSGGQCKGDFMQLTIPLINISWWTSAWRSNAADFGGCSSNIGAWDVDTIEFKNKWGGDQGLCLSDVKAW